MQVAVSYIGDKAMPVLFEFHVGDIDRGASLSFLSQYPNEDEILIPPLSYLEVIGEPFFEHTDKGGVTVYPARINCNLKSQTIEEIKGHRQKEILAMLPYLDSALRRDMSVLDEALTADLKEEAQVEKIDRLPEQYVLPNVESDAETDDPQLWFTTKAIAPETDVVLSCSWRDQGWGGQKGQLFVRLRRAGDAHAALRALLPNDDWHPVSSLAPHEQTKMRVRICTADYSDAKSILLQLEFGYRVGGGGGHEIYLSDANLTIEASQSLMKGRIGEGDHVLSADGPARKGVVEKDRGSGETEPYKVRWDDGEESDWLNSAAIVMEDAWAVEKKETLLKTLQAESFNDFGTLSAEIATPEKIGWLNQDSNYKTTTVRVIDFKNDRLSTLVRKLSALDERYLQDPLTTDLHVAAREGRGKTVAALLAMGSPVDALDKRKWSALHWAAWHGHAKVAELLIDKNADVNALNNWGWSPLKVAVQESKDEVADVLRKAGGREPFRGETWVVTGTPDCNVNWITDDEDILFHFKLWAGQAVMNSRVGGKWDPFTTMEERFLHPLGEVEQTWTITVDDAGFHVSDENDKVLHVYAHRRPWSEFARVDVVGNVLVQYGLLRDGIDRVHGQLEEEDENEDEDEEDEVEEDEDY